jgi:glycerol-3-phosphate dehydrogenase
MPFNPSTSQQHTHSSHQPVFCLRDEPSAQLSECTKIKAHETPKAEWSPKYMGISSTVPHRDGGAQGAGQRSYDVDKTTDITMNVKEASKDNHSQSLHSTQIALCIEVMQLMSDCLIEGLCPRRTHKILLLLNQVPNIDSATTQLGQLEAALESTREAWHAAHSQQLRG